MRWAACGSGAFFAGLAYGIRDGAWSSVAVNAVLFFAAVGYGVAMETRVECALAFYDNRLRADHPVGGAR